MLIYFVKFLSQTWKTIAFKVIFSPKTFFWCKKFISMNEIIQESPSFFMIFCDHWTFIPVALGNSHVLVGREVSGVLSCDQWKKDVCFDLTFVRFLNPNRWQCVFYFAIVLRRYNRGLSIWLVGHIFWKLVFIHLPHQIAPTFNWSNHAL